MLQPDCGIEAGLLVSEDSAGNEKDIGALHTVFRGKEQVDKIVVFPSLGCVGAGEDFLSIAEFGGEGVINFALPGVFFELLHDLISVGLVLEMWERGLLGTRTD